MTKSINLNQKKNRRKIFQVMIFTSFPEFCSKLRLACMISCLLSFAATTKDGIFEDKKMKRELQNNEAKSS